MSRMSESTVQSTFHEFKKFFAKHSYHDHVRVPTVEKHDVH